MTVFSKTPLQAKTKRARTRFNGFTLGDTAKGALYGESKNCDVTDGILRTGLGFVGVKDTTTNTQMTSKGLPEKCRLFAMHGINAVGEAVETIGALDDTGVLYTYQTLSRKWTAVYTFTTKMRAVRVVDEDANLQTALIGEQGLFLYTYGDVMQTTDMTELGDKAHLACFAQGRLFYIEAPYTLRYSKAYAPTDFSQSIDDGGSIVLPSDCGEVMDIVAAGNYIFVIYEQAISIVELHGSSSEMSVRNVEYHGGRIFEDSAGVWSADGATLFFLSEQGVYKVQRGVAEHVCKNVIVYPKRSGQVCEHGFFEGKYAVSYLHVNGTRKCLIADAVTGEGYFTDIPLSLSEYKGGTICCLNGMLWTIHRYGDVPLGFTRTFTVSNLDFGTKNSKLLESLTFEGTGNSWVVVGNGKTEKRTVFVYENGTCTVPIRLKGSVFSLQIGLADGACMYALTADTTSFYDVK